jgi:hypothetical protein
MSQINLIYSKQSYFLRPILILKIYLCVFRSNRHFPSDFPTKIPQAFVFCAMHARRSFPYITLHLITLLFGEQCNPEVLYPAIPTTILLLDPPLELTPSSALCSRRLEFYILTSETNFYLFIPFL